MKYWQLGFLAAVVAVFCAIVVAVLLPPREPSPQDQSAAAPPTPAMDDNTLNVLFRGQCIVCHQFPEPSILPRYAWRRALTRMQEMSPAVAMFDLEQMVRWFEQRAPYEVPDPRPDPGSIRHSGLEFVTEQLVSKDLPGVPATSNVKFVDFTGDESLELMVTDMANGAVLCVSFSDKGPVFEHLASVPHPARAEVVDLNQDGLRDVLVADLGSFHPEEHKRGQVVWLRATPEGYQVEVIGKGFGRVADVKAADLDDDGDLDVVFNEFGSRSSTVPPGGTGMTGGFWLLENQTEDWSKPIFVPREIDPRAGGVNVEVADIDGDGRLDLITLLAQQHERVSIFYGLGGLKFEASDAHLAPHPAWGYSGLQLVDADGDTDLDLLLANGDGFDAGGLLHPFHGVQLIENLGNREYRPHPLLPLPGTHRGDMADMDGDGDLDIVASAFHPFLGREKSRGLAAVVWFENTAAWTFTRHIMAMNTVNHPTFSLADYDRDGDVDIAFGVFMLGPAGGNQWAKSEKTAAVPSVLLSRNQRF